MHKNSQEPKNCFIIMVDKHCGWSFEPAQRICAFKKSFTYLRTASNPQNTNSYAHITHIICNNDPSRIDLRKRFHENGHKIQDWTGSIIPGFAEWQEIDATTAVCLLELEEQNMSVGGWLPVDVWAEKENKVLLTHYVTHRRRWENGGPGSWSCLSGCERQRKKYIYTYQFQF